MVASKPASDWRASTYSARNCERTHRWKFKINLQYTVYLFRYQFLWQDSSPSRPLWSASSSPPRQHVRSDSEDRPSSLAPGRDALTSCSEWTAMKPKREQTSELQTFRAAENKHLGSCQQTCMQFVNMTHTAMSLEKILRSSGLVSMQSFRQLSRKLVWWQSTSSMLDACRRKRETVSRRSHFVCSDLQPQQRISSETEAAFSRLCFHQIKRVTHRFQVVLHDVPGGLHHLKHHVVLDVLHKVEHALSEGERSSKPAVWTEAWGHFAGWHHHLNSPWNSASTHHLGERKEYCLKSLLLIHTLHSSLSTCLQENMCLNNIWYLVRAFLQKEIHKKCIYRSLWQLQSVI